MRLNIGILLILLSLVFAEHLWAIIFIGAGAALVWPFLDFNRKEDE